MRQLGILCVFFILGGCSSAIISTPVKNGDIAKGVVYTLPKQLIKFTLTREGITKEDLEKQRNTAKANNDSAASAAKKQKGLADEWKKRLDKAIEEKSKAQKNIKLKLDLARIDQKVLEDYYTKTSEELQFAKIKLRAFKNNYFEDTVKLTPLKPVPDSSKRFVARIDKGSFSSETIEIKTTPEGLLSGGSAKSEGQLDEIFIALVKSITAFTGVPSYGLRASNLPGTYLNPAACPMKDQKFVHIFDLATDPDLGKLNQKLIQNNLCYRLDLVSENTTQAPEELEGMEKTSTTKVTKSDCQAGFKYKPQPGLLYPRKSAIQFNLHEINRSDGAEALVQSFYPMIIDNRALGVLSFDKAIFADNEYEFEFKDGLLTRYKSVTPNEFLSFLSMFPEAAKAIVQIPAEILQLKVNYSSVEENYYKEKQAVQDARLAYEKSLMDQLQLEKDEL